MKNIHYRLSLNRLGGKSSQAGIADVPKDTQASGSSGHNEETEQTMMAVGNLEQCTYIKIASPQRPNHKLRIIARKSGPLYSLYRSSNTRRCRKSSDFNLLPYPLYSLTSCQHCQASASNWAHWKRERYSTDRYS